MTRTFVALAAAGGLLVAATGSATAQPFGARGHGGGASAHAPGIQMQQWGSVYGMPGASGYAPGHLKRSGSVRGAYGYAPGRWTSGAKVKAKGKVKVR